MLVTSEAIARFTFYTATQMLKWKQLMPLIPIYAAVQM